MKKLLYFAAVAAVSFGSIWRSAYLALQFEGDCWNGMLERFV